MKSTSTLLAGYACALACLGSPVAHAGIVNHGDGSFTDTTTGYLWRTLAQYDGLDFATAQALLPSGYHVADAAELATLTAAVPADPAQFDAALGALGAKPEAGILWGYYGSGTTYLWYDGYASAWATNAASNPYGWTNWNYALTAGFSQDGLSLFAVDTAPAAVPVPATLSLVGLGAAMLVLRRRTPVQA